MRTIQLIDSLQAGGAEKMAVSIANALSQRGIDSHLVVTRLEGPLKNQVDSKVDYLFLQRKYLIDVVAFVRLYRYIAHHKINIIHAHATSWFIAVIMKLGTPSVKIIWHDHYGKSEQLQQRNNIYLKWGSHFFSAIIVVNQKLLNWSRKTLNYSKSYYIPNFVKNGESLKLEKLPQLRGMNGKRIICLANLRPQKDFINLLKAFKIVQTEFPNWSLHIVGAIGVQAYYDSLVQFIYQNQLEGAVFFYKSVSEGSSVLNQANIGVLSSRSEGLPLALLEYGIAKLAVVVTKVGECEAVVENGVNGFVVPPQQEEELAEKMKLLFKEEALRKNFGNLLFQKVQENYSEEIIINQLLTLYQELD